MNENTDSPLTENMALNNNKKSSWLKEVAREVLIFIILAVCVVLPFRMFVAEPYLVDGASMDPTFKTGDYLIVDKISYKFKEPERNSVVILKYPLNTSKNFIKRIIGLPGDTIKVDGNSITIQNKENPSGFSLPDSYVVHTCEKSDLGCVSSFSKTLGDEEYFVMGDNRAESYDSRSWGVLPKKDIVGRPVLRLLPLNKISILPGNEK